MEDKFQTMVIAFVFITLFGVLILSSVTIIGNEYEKNLTEITGGALSLTSFNDTLTDLEETTTTWKSFFSTNPWDIAGVVVTGIFTIIKTVYEIILSPFALISDIMNNILGVPSYVTIVLLLILLIIFVFAVWRLIKVGD